MIKVFIDGACEPINPGGTAAYGLIVYRDNTLIFQKGEVIGSGSEFSNNVAEYAGLLAFLNLRKVNEPATIYSDSQLLVNQMSGLWSAHKGLYLGNYKKAINLCAGQPFRFIWIPKEENIEADTLSLIALQKAGIKIKRR